MISIHRQLPYHRFLFIAGLLYLVIEVVTEELGLVLDFLADNGSLRDAAAFNESCKTDELAELAAQVELVTFGSYKKNVARAGIKNLQKRGNINVVQCQYLTHGQSSFQ